MAFPVPRDERIRFSWGICKPFPGSDIDDAVARIATSVGAIETTGSARAAILRSVNGSWAAVFILWNGGSETDQSPNNIPAAGEFRKELCKFARVVDSGWLQLSSHEHRDASFAKLCVGDIASLRRIYSSRKRQEVLAYCCLAVSKAYFAHTEGFRCCTFYKSMDGKQIVGLGVWDGIESAYALLDNGKGKGSPGDPYWIGLGAKKIKYEVCQVVYVTKEMLPQPSDSHSCI